jgi:23S rRNA pseudouridine2605 synthase
MAARKKSARRGRPERQRAVRVVPAAAPQVDDGLIRLNRFLAGAGICSRRRADELIAQRRVTVNGEVVVELGRRIDPARDVVRYEGRKVAAEKSVYVLFNKPRDVVCTNARHEVRRRAIDFLEGVRGRIFTVGRLDADSEGLLLLTNDGEFAQKLTHPRYGVPKTYAVLVRGRPEAEHLEKARGGVWLAEGRTGRAQIRVERRGRDRSYLKVTLREGRNREIRRVFARLGYPVLALKRVRIGGLSLHGLKPGGHRFLRPEEVRGLLEAAQEGA